MELDTLLKIFIFAVTFHRQRRTRRNLRTELLEIPDIGEKTAQRLLRPFGSVRNLRRQWKPHKQRENDLLVIVPCGQSKVWDKSPDHGPPPAHDAYTGSPFKVTYSELRQ